MVRNNAKLDPSATRAASKPGKQKHVPLVSRPKKDSTDVVEPLLQAKPFGIQAEEKDVLNMLRAENCLSGQGRK